MTVPDSSRPQDIGYETTRAETRTLPTPIGTVVATRIGDAVWSVLHIIGAHRWREGYETDPERGMSRYRGSRCTICDAPWEGW